MQCDYKEADLLNFIRDASGIKEPISRGVTGVSWWNLV